MGLVIPPERANLWETRIARRIADLDARIAQLRSRRGELGALAQSHGSSGDQLSSARRSEQAAHAQLVSSVHGAIQALRLSAIAHERAASAHEHLATHHAGDASEHQNRAATHRAAALLDYLTADHAEALPDPPQPATTC
jgi:hypothetical protein